MARPSKYDNAKANQVATLLRGGCTRKDAAGSVGITDDTFANWLRRYSDFSDLVAAAEAFVGAKMAAKVTAAADTDWRAALEWLKRRRRDEWGDNLSLRNLTDEELIATAEGRVPGDNPAGDMPPTAGTG